MWETQEWEDKTKLDKTEHMFEEMGYTSLTQNFPNNIEKTLKLI